MYLVSACLCGVNCKYNGKNNLDPLMLSWLNAGKALPVCPEQLGGLATPRPACEISGGSGTGVLEGTARVIDRDGKDHTEAFVRGARETLYIALNSGISKAVFKFRSPSCSPDDIYDGSFSSRLVTGGGVTAAMLRRHGITVYSEQHIRQLQSDPAGFGPVSE